MSRSTSDRHLIDVLRSVEVLIESGVGLETALTHVADGDYGSISDVFRQVVLDAADGRFMDDVLTSHLQRLGPGEEGLRKLFLVLIQNKRGDIDLSNALKVLADKEVAERRLEVKEFTQTVSGAQNRYLLLGILVPIILWTLQFTNSLLNSVDLGPVADVSGIPIGPAETGICYGITLLLLALMAWGLHKKAPRI